MSRYHYRALERMELLRFLINYFESTSGGTQDPQLHARLLEEFRNQLAQLELEEAERRNQGSLFQRLVSFVFGRARAIRALGILGSLGAQHFAPLHKVGLTLSDVYRSSL